MLLGREKGCWRARLHGWLAGWLVEDTEFEREY